MSEPTNTQIVMFQGKPVAVVLPYEEFLRLSHREPEEHTTPQEVMMKRYVNGQSLIQAWREYLELSQEEVAKRMGVTQAAYQQMEKKSARPRKATLDKIAAAFGLDGGLLKI